jgi:hypothetical protein
MGPLGFVNWRRLNRAFCLLMWLLALVLALIVIAHSGDGSAARHVVDIAH